MPLTLTHRPYHLPFRRPLPTAFGTLTHRQGLLVRVAGGDGPAGWGEAAPLPGFGGESLAMAESTLVAIAAEIGEAGGLDAPAAIAGFSAELARRFPDAPCARAAVELALADSAARLAGVPLWRWLATWTGIELNGDKPSVQVNATLGADAPEEAAAQAREAIAAGFRTLKVKVGGAREVDWRRIAAVREAVGPGIAIRLDANGAWTEAEAERRILDLAPFGIEYLEQPLSAGATAAEREACMAGMARLRRLGVPLAADELLLAPGAAESLIALTVRSRTVSTAELAPADILILKPMLLGGLSRACAIARMARDGGMEVVVTSALDSAVGRTAALHLAAALGIRRACGLATGELLADDVADGPAVLDGAMRPPSHPLLIRLLYH